MACTKSCSAPRSNCDNSLALWPMVALSAVASVVSCSAGGVAGAAVANTAVAVGMADAMIGAGAGGGRGGWFAMATDTAYPICPDICPMAVVI